MSSKNIFQKKYTSNNTGLSGNDFNINSLILSKLFTNNISISGSVYNLVGVDNNNNLFINTNDQYVTSTYLINNYITNQYLTNTLANYVLGSVLGSTYPTFNYLHSELNTNWVNKTSLNSGYQVYNFSVSNALLNNGSTSLIGTVTLGLSGDNNKKLFIFGPTNFYNTINYVDNTNTSHPIITSQNISSYLSSVINTYSNSASSTNTFDDTITISQAGLYLFSFSYKCIGSLTNFYFALRDGITSTALPNCVIQRTVSESNIIESGTFFASLSAQNYIIHFEQNGTLSSVSYNATLVKIA